MRAIQRIITFAYRLKIWPLGIAILISPLFVSKTAFGEGSISSDPGNQGYTITLYAPSSAPNPGSPGSQLLTQTKGGQTLYPIMLPTLTTNTSEFANAPCVAVFFRYYSDKAQTGISRSLAPRLWYALNRHYGPCVYRSHTTSKAPTPPTISTSVIQKTISRQLPSPTLALDPTFALIGVKSYVIAHSLLTDAITRSTQFGFLSARATGSISINFGDGSPTFGPTTNLGGPWPIGTLTHAYYTPGCYRVSITENWIVTYEISGQSGTLRGLTTEGSLSPYCVYQAGSQMIR